MTDPMDYKDAALDSLLKLESRGVVDVYGVTLHEIRFNLELGSQIAAALAISSAELLGDEGDKLPDTMLKRSLRGASVDAVSAAREAVGMIKAAAVSAEDAILIVDELLLSLESSSFIGGIRNEWRLAKRSLGIDMVAAETKAEACLSEVKAFSELAVASVDSNMNLHDHGVSNDG